MAGKKNFTKADGAIDRLFMPQTQAANIDNDTQDTNAINNTHIENISYIDNNVLNINNEHKANEANDTNIICNTYTTNDTDLTNKSKRHNDRGKRVERFGLLLDERLKEDLRHLSMATGSKSVNDFIVTVLIEYVERSDSQLKLTRYRKILQG